MPPKITKATKKESNVRRSQRSAASSPVKSAITSKAIPKTQSKTVKIEGGTQDSPPPSYKSRRNEGPQQYSPPSTPIKSKDHKSSLGKRRNVELDSNVQSDVEETGARSPKKSKTSQKDLEAQFASRSIGPVRSAKPKVNTRKGDITESDDDKDDISDIMIISDGRKDDVDSSISKEGSAVEWSDSDVGYRVTQNQKDKGKYVARFEDEDTDDIPSDAPGNISPSPKTIYELEKGTHQLSLPKNSRCEILTAFTTAERESGGTGVFIDPLMRKSYKGLAPLPILTFKRFNGEEANNPIFLPTSWKGSFPNIDLEWIATNLKFENDGNIVNLARINPTELIAVMGGTKGRRICHSGRVSGSISTSAVCVSFVQVISCHILEPITTAGGQVIKQISGLHHSVENERLQSCCCVVFGARGMQAPIRDGVLTFGTRPEKIAVPRVGGSTLMSPVKPKVHQTIDLAKGRDWVKHSDDVPIYDLRFPIAIRKSGKSSSTSNITPDFILTSKNIRRIPQTYSTYSRGNEVPIGSLALIGYTMGCYEKDGELVAAPNLNWVVVIAADD